MSDDDQHTEANDVRANDVRANDAQASDAQASDAQTSDAQSSDKQAGAAQPSDDQPIAAQVTPAQRGHDDSGIRRALIAGIIANFGVAVVKFVAFSFTHSAAMLAESVHSLADSSNQLLLFVGLKRSKRPATASHPFGFTVERYFWSFVVAVNIFVIGAAVAIYEGIEKLRPPHEIENVMWNFAALGIAAVFETYALRVAWKEFSHWRSTQTGSLWSSLRKSKDLSLPTVLFEDSAALLGLLIATIGISLAQVLHMPQLDGVASILIGVILLGVAWFLAIESHSLLIGEAAPAEDQLRIRNFVGQDQAVERVLDMFTLQRGPNTIIVGLDLEFIDGLETGEIEVAVQRLEKGIKERVPAAKHIFIEASAFQRRSTT